MTDNENNYEHISFIDNNYWNLNNYSPSERTVISMYFAITTLSTIGIGDYYPKNNIERIVGSCLLLVGVMTYSFIMGQMMKNIKSLE